MKSVSGKTVMVTGGAGFVGSNFCEKLLKMGADVVVYDNLSSGRYELIEKLVANRRFKFIRGELLDLQKLNLQFRKHRPDVVIHLAANPDVRRGLANTRLDLEQGTIVTYNVMEAARKNDAKDVLFSSSSVVYGETTVRPTPEDYGPLKPISLYGASKLASEGLITSFSHLYGFDHYIYRFANVVGNNLTHSVILDLIGKLKKNRKTLEILGDGRQRKGYLDVGDCVDAMTLVYQRSGDGSNIYNIALKDQISVREIAEIIVKKLSPPTKLRYTGTPRGWPGDVIDSLLDNRRIKKIGFRPKYDTSRKVIMHAVEANKFRYRQNK
jgi:UDP-glucose 4-epimerase